MKRPLSVLLMFLLAVVFAVPATAGDKPYWDYGKNRGDRHGKHDNHYFDRARVIKVKPIYREVRTSVPQEQCWNEQQRRPVKHRVRHESPEKALVGGLVGGIIGNQLGKHSGNRNLATFAGTVIGATVLNSASHTEYTGEYQVVNERRCRTEYVDHREEQLMGYRVVYRYKGETFKTRMDRHPGKFLRVRVNVTPVN